MMDRTSSRWLPAALLLGILLGAATMPPAALAQRLRAPQVAGLEELTVSNVFLPAPRELRQTLAAAEEAIRDGRYSEAASLLGAVLSRAESEDYFIDPRNEAGTQISLKTEALRLLSEMPPAGLRLYELQFGAEAQVLLEEAVASRDLEKLVEVTRRFPQTRAGDLAMILLGQHYLDHNQPLAGAICFSRASRSSETLQSHDPQLSLLLALCWRSAGYPEKASDVLLQLQSRMPDVVVDAGETQWPMFDDPSQAMAWFDQVMGGGFVSVEAAAPQRDWIMHRGDAARNARASGGAPLGSFRWRLPLTISRADEELMLKIYSQNSGSGEPALPALHALAIGDVILVRDSDRLWAIDFASGKRQWSYPWEIDEDQGDLDSLGSQQTANSPRMQQLYQRIWADSAYGQISSDGQLVFLIDGLGVASNSSSYAQMIVGPGGVRQANPNMPRSYNQLVALDLDRQGAIRWIAGGSPRTEQEGADVELNGAFFLGAPLPVMGKLYALVEINSEIRLVVLPASTGQLEWSQQIAHVENSNILQDAQRRLAGASPSFADGVLVCPTSTGAVVAVDVANRALLWGFQYERSAQLVRQQLMLQVNPSQQILLDSWSDATVTIQQGMVLVTPIDAEKLYCLDLLTGEEVWEARDRDGLSFVACVHKGHAVLIGSNTVVALNLEDGSEVWETNLADYAGSGQPVPSGRGLYCEDFYYLPTTESTLLEIDLRDGSVAHAVDTPAVLGNLIAHRGEIISLGTISLDDSRYKVSVDSLRQVEPLREELTQRLTQHPDDIWALLRQGELLRYDNQPAEALEVFRRAYLLAVEAAESTDSPEAAGPLVEETRSLLVDMLLERLQTDFDATHQLALELDAEVDQPVQRRQYLRLMAIGLEQIGRNRESFDYFMRLLEVEDSHDAWSRPGSEIDRILPLDEGLRLDTDRWVAERISTLLENASSADQQKMRQVIGEKIARVAAEGTAAQRYRWASLFRDHPAALEMNLALAAEYEQAGALLSAEMLLAEIAECDRPELASLATLHLARLLEGAGYPTAAALQYQRLLDEWPEQVIEEGRSGQAIVAALAPESEVGRWLAHAPAPSGRVYQEDAPASTGMSLGNTPLFPVELLQTSGPRTPGLSIVFDQQNNTLFVRDWRGRELRRIFLSAGGAQYPINYNYLRARLHGHLLVLSLGLEVLGIDLLSDPAQQPKTILWRFDLATMVTARVPVHGMMQLRIVQNPWTGQRAIPCDSQDRPLGELGPLDSRGVYFQRGGELLCVDPLSGEIIWSRRDLEAGSGLFGDGELLLVASPSGSTARVYRSSDGSELGTRNVPSVARRWLTHGRAVLTWSEQGEKVTLRLYDPWEQRDIWSYACQRDSRGFLVDGDLIAIMEPRGRFAILRLADGKPVIGQDLLPEDSLHGIDVFASRRQFLLVTHGDMPVSRDNRHGFSQAPGGPHAQLISGRIYAFDRASGEPLWQVPAEVDQYSIPRDQPGEIPVLVLLRHETVTRDSTRQSTGSVIVLDKRDGRLLFAQDQIPTLILEYQVSYDDEQQTVTVNLPNKSILLKLTDDPTPPAPPLQTSLLEVLSSH